MEVTQKLNEIGIGNIVEEGSQVDIINAVVQVDYIQDKRVQS